MRCLIYTLLIMATINISIVDSDGDRSKAVFLIDFPDGSTDRLVVDKKDVESPAASKAVEDIIAKKMKWK